MLSLPKDEPNIPADFTEITDPRKRLFLQALAQYPRFGRATRAAGVCSKTSWNWRHDAGDPVFLEACEVAWKLGIERAEGELWRRGIEGYEKPVYHQGQLIGTEWEKDTTAAIFMLKGARPDVYRENVRQEHVGPGGGPIQAAIAFAELTSEQIQERMARAARVIEASRQAELPQAQVQEHAPQTPEARYAAALAARSGNGNGSDGNA